MTVERQIIQQDVKAQPHNVLIRLSYSIEHNTTLRKTIFIRSYGLFPIISLSLQKLQAHRLIVAASFHNMSSVQFATRKVYRDLFHLIRQQSNNTPLLQELREKFRGPLDDNETMEQRLKDAESRLSLLRMKSKKSQQRGKSAGRWVYRNGERLEADEEGTIRDSKGKVVSNWNGKNLDPESVKLHRQQLRRAGFVNNTHAKGLF